MKHLKKFNESRSDLDFETFKEIMERLHDEFPSEMRFDDYSGEEDPFYDFHIAFPKIEADMIFEDGVFSFDYLDYMDSEEPKPLPHDLMGNIDSHISYIRKIQRESENAIRIHSQFKEMMEVFIDEIKPLLESFSNYLDVTIGASIDELRICFEIKY